MPNIKYLVEGGHFPNFHTSSILLQCEKLNLIFDSGFPYDIFLLRKSLEEQKIEGKDISYVIISHYHIDHCGNLDLFPEAKIVLSSFSLEAIYGLWEMLLVADNYSDPLLFLMEYFVKEKDSIDRETLSNMARMRAMANIVYKNRDCYKQIIELEKEKRIMVVEKRTEVADVILDVKQIHTKGDILLSTLDHEGEKVSLVGDIIPSKMFVFGEKKPMLTIDDAINYQREIYSVLEATDIIVPGHGKAFKTSEVLERREGKW